MRASEKVRFNVEKDVQGPKQMPPPSDPYLKANTSLNNKLLRVAWSITCALLFSPSPRPMHGWRAGLLRMFGAKIGPGCHIYPKARIWAPWNLRCDDVVAIADGAEIYNPELIELKSHAIVSQGAYLCGASHDLRDPSFPMISGPIVVGPYAWVCARSTVQMGVTIGEGAVLGLGAIATKDLSAWTVYGGVPAQPISKRPKTHEQQATH
jgi:putative colanic acid biosynthesis acetyltransferase WcaF